MRKLTILVFVFVGALCHFGQGFPTRRGHQRSKIARLLKLLESKERKNHSPGKRVFDTYDPYHEEEFHDDFLPSDTYWGGDEWMGLEDENGHARDIIDNTDTELGSIAMNLIASFEVLIQDENGTHELHPLIDFSNLPVQLAQNKDHHKQIPEKRNFDLQSSKWTGGIIPYVIDTAKIPGAKEQEQIRKGIKDMNDLTCLKIIPKDQATSVPHNSFIRFTDDGGGCWSYVGMGDGLQDIGLSPGCYDKSTVIHEIMHAIGMQHEQQRTDRDKYLDMLWNNIQNGKNNENMKLENTDYKNSFDVESVLQYGLYSFAIDNSKKSMRIKNRELEFLPDTAAGLTFYDVEDINDGYDCVKQECSGKTLPSCINEGFVGHKCKCVCPSGLKGTRCELVDSDEGCGKVITLKEGESAEIISPNYPNPHPTGKNCVWLIRGLDSSNIHLNIVDMKLKKNETLVRCYHWLEVRGNLLGQTGIKRCGTISGTKHKSSNAAIDGKGNLMMLKFNSKFSKDEPADKGFKLTVTALSGGNTPAPKPCDNSPCKNNGVCTNSGSSFTCACATGWSGPTCTDKVTPAPKPCDSSPCKNNGVCTDNGSSFTCACTAGWSGPTCTDQITPAPKPCDSSPCKNNGVCTDNGSSFSCACVNGWSGPTCTVAPPVTTELGKCTFEPTDSTCFLESGYTKTKATSTSVPNSANTGTHFVGTVDDTTIYLDFKQTLGIVDGQDYCVTFFYFASGFQSYIDVCDGDYNVCKGTNDSGQWKRNSVDIVATASPSFIMMTAEASGFIAIDDVTLSKGKCR